MKKYIRTERPNLFEPNVYISMVVKFSGTVTKNALHQAIKATYSANEATMSQIVLEENGDAYYIKREKSGCMVFFDNRNWGEIIREQEKTPFSLNTGELVRAFIISEEKEVTLLVMAHHLAGDGKSILILVRDIADSLSGKPLTYKPMQIIDKPYLSKKAKLPLSVILAVKNANRKWRRTGKVFTWDDYYDLHNEYWKNHSSDIEIKSYSANELKSRCKNGITLNSYLITELLRESPEIRKIGVPISIRENSRGMSNLTSGIAIKYRYKQDRSFEENLIRVHKKLYSKFKNKTAKYFVLLFIGELSPALVDSVLLNTYGCYNNKLSQKMAEIMGYKGTGGRDLGVTNLMKIDIQGNYVNFQINDIIFIPPKISYTKNIVGISTFGDKLTVTYHRMKSEKTPKQTICILLLFPPKRLDHPS